jgi:hypothetical protein
MENAKPKIPAFADSVRSDSLNKKLSELPQRARQSP